MGQVFEITGRGLVPIVSQNLPIGTRVIQDHRGKQGVIVGETQIGYTVIFPDGSSTDSQRLDCRSPFTRIRLVEGADLASAFEIEQLKIQREWKREQDRQLQSEAATKHANDAAQFEAELREKYSWAKPNKPSANLKKELSLVFPGVKFSVRYQSFSGGDSIDYSWTLGPTPAEVEKIAGKYQDGHFNGMEDIHEHDNTAYGAAVEKVLGRAKYVMPSRTIPREMHEQVGRLLCERQHVDYQECEKGAVHLFGQGDSRWLSDHVYQLLARTSFPANPEIEGVKWSDEPGGYELVFK